jgi:hypothetical protein
MPHFLVEYTLEGVARGAVITSAEDADAALDRAHRLGLDPGGETDAKLIADPGDPRVIDQRLRPDDAAAFAQAEEPKPAPAQEEAPAEAVAAPEEAAPAPEEAPAEPEAEVEAPAPAPAPKRRRSRKTDPAA